MATRSSKYFAKDVLVPAAEAQAVEVQTLEGGKYAVTIGEKRVEVDVLALPTGQLSFLIGDESYAADFEAKGDSVSVLLRSQISRFEIVDEMHWRLRSSALGGATDGKQVVSAPMPGKVVKIFVKQGDAVTEGQPIVVVEAMKMENELKAPKAGTVVSVSVKEGATVENGATLLAIE